MNEAGKWETYKKRLISNGLHSKAISFPHKHELNSCLRLIVFRMTKTRHHHYRFKTFPSPGSHLSGSLIPHEIQSTVQRWSSVLHVNINFHNFRWSLVHCLQKVFLTCTYFLLRISHQHQHCLFLLLSYLLHDR